MYSPVRIGVHVAMAPESVCLVLFAGDTICSIHGKGIFIVKSMICWIAYVSDLQVTVTVFNVSLAL